MIPTKALPEAKSRLLPATVDASAHRRLVEAIRADTVAAASAAPAVARVVLIADRPAGPGVLVQTEPGLNAALVEAAEFATVSWPEDGVGALVGDLPALRPDEIDSALRAAAGHARSFVPDSPGTGTTLLTAQPGTVLRPAFGPGSARRHAAGAVELASAGPGLRHDVDTADDLAAAAELGLGPATSAVLAETGIIARST